ncbi:hypothetical protein [Aeromonas sp. R6-2]|uniref:hypothetical protein n=1 Tax=Aeromonas sp. R6-2 TaxID=3138472 RepID=UPI0034A1B666
MKKPGAAESKWDLVGQTQGWQGLEGDSVMPGTGGIKMKEHGRSSGGGVENEKQADRLFFPFVVTASGLNPGLSDCL